MAEVITVFAVIAGLVFLGFISELIFRKTRIPDVLLLIGAGILINHVFGWVNAEDLGFGARLFTTFALVFILFQGSLNIQFKKLFESLSRATLLTVLSFALTFFVVSAIALFSLKLPFMTSMLLGTILGGTSSAVVIPLVQNLTIKKRYGLILTLESAISDVLCIVGTITIIAIIKTGEISGSSVFRSILSSFSLALVIGLVAGFIWMMLLSKSRLLMDSYMVTVAVVMGLYAFVESPFVGASGAIAALTFGLVLGNSKGIRSTFLRVKNHTDKEPAVRSALSHSARGFYREISFFVKVFFFVYLGILIDLSQPMIFGYALIFTAGMLIIRPFVVTLSFWGEDVDVKSKAIMESLIPKGLAAAVLAQIAVQEAIPGADTVLSLVLAIILVSIVLVAIFAFFAETGHFKGLLPFLNIHKEETKAIQKEISEDDMPVFSEGKD
ncbi:MAG: cation:proton antiporter [archaeon]